MIRRPPRSNRTGHTLSLHDALPIFREADGGALVFSWNPNGTVDGAIVGGTENADGANLNQEISRLLPGQTIVDTGLGLFSATAGLLDAGLRSEEHTSELQSLMRISYAVFCLKK